MEKHVKSKKIRKLCCTVLVALLLTMAVPFVTAAFRSDAGTTDVQAAASYVAIRFWDSDGSAYYGNLRIHVEAGKTSVLPEVPAVTGYRALGWSAQKNAATASYSAGSKVRVTKNVSLYAVRSKISYSKALFYTNQGTQTTKFTALTQKVETGTYTKLPELPAMKGYQAVGWATEKNAKAAKYAPGKKFRLTKDRKFYAVYRKSKYYTVDFYSSSGKTSTAYKKLKLTIEEGKKAKLPRLPEKAGYTAMGWSTAVNGAGTIYKAGTSLSLTKNLKFYAVYKKSVTLTLLQNNGAEYKSYTVGKETYFTLPSVSNTKASVFLGWDTVPGKKADPAYEAGEQLIIRGNMTLYMVRMDRAFEEELTASDLQQAGGWRQNYKHTIFVGDSRTVRMARALKTQFGSDTSILGNISYVAASGQGLNWLQEEGYPGILQELEKLEKKDVPAAEQEPGAAQGADTEPEIQAPEQEKPTAIIFNLGVNDLLRAGEFVSYLESIAPQLQARNCRLFFMSVNPVNSKTMAVYDNQNGTNYARASKSRTETSVREFNGVMKMGLRSYEYIDTYTTLMKTGFSTDVGINGIDTGKDDGLHYSTKTSKRIFRCCMSFLAGGFF